MPASISPDAARELFAQLRDLTRFIERWAEHNDHAAFIRAASGYLAGANAALAQATDAQSAPVAVVWPVYTNEANERMTGWDERASGDPHDVENYTNEANSEQVIYLTTDEREEFESETGANFDSDTLKPETFTRLHAWLKEGGAL